tara:strand:- start:642 stop:950 length:309 start_codon:yes stop_codon:yes gene_type:complete
MRLGHNIEALAAHKTLLPQDAQFQALDPDGTASFNVILPAEEASQGLFFIIKNTANAGSEDLVVLNDAADTVATLTQNMLCICFCDGTSWGTTGLVAYSAGT